MHMSLTDIGITSNNKLLMHMAAHLLTWRTEGVLTMPLNPRECLNCHESHKHRLHTTARWTLRQALHIKMCAYIPISHSQAYAWHAEHMQADQQQRNMLSPAQLPPESSYMTKPALLTVAGKEQVAATAVVCKP